MHFLATVSYFQTIKTWRKTNFEKLSFSKESLKHFICSRFNQYNIKQYCNDVLYLIYIHTEMCNSSKFYSHFDGQSIHLNFSKALQKTLKFSLLELWWPGTGSPKVGLRNHSHSDSNSLLQSFGGQQRLAMSDRFWLFIQTLNNNKKPFNSIFHSKTKSNHSFKEFILSKIR